MHWLCLMQKARLLILMAEESRQVSTTGYLAVLCGRTSGGFQIQPFHAHEYIQPSMDAAISEEGGKDLIFTNNTDSPIYIMGTAANGVIDFSIYGVETRAAGRTVYRSETLSQTDATFSLKADDTIALARLATATGHVGMEAQAVEGRDGEREDCNDAG